MNSNRPLTEPCGTLQMNATATEVPAEVLKICQEKIETDLCVCVFVCVVCVCVCVIV